MFNEPAWILKRVTLSPNRTALVDVHTNVSWTYTMLKNRILRWTSTFTDNGYKKGERIAVLAPNQPELFAILFACKFKGLIYVPLNWRLSKFEIVSLLNDCSPAVLLFDDIYQSLIQEIDFKQMKSIHSIDNMNEISETVDIGQQEPSNPWMMIYTGGTTGKPKGVVLSTYAVNSNAMNTIISWGLTEEDTTINYMPLFHTGGINALSIPILMAGGQVVIGNRFDAEEAMRATDHYAATISLFVPTMYQSMINMPYFNQTSFSSMKVFLSGGAPCPETIYTKFYAKGHKFKEGYGLTEAGPNNFFIRPEVARRKIGSVGKPMFFNSVKVVNPSGSQCDVNEVGELYIKGPHVFSSYWNKPQDTVSAFHDGWLRTGDLARYDEDGDHYIVGRKKDIIISGGENIYPQEIEQCLTNFGEIKEAAVVAKKDEKWGESIIAFVTEAEGYAFNHDKVIAHCKKFLGSFKIPKEIIVLPEMPKTHIGKIDKNALLHYIMKKA
ncbi:AMP-binding protein [Sporosarcina sp. Marseille-Q4063]|uniref:AMP-binding protein n=1 Tax=Sporosarcina sp. Marseille-Q4063 TaxID=2810514 RepID=UPI001BAED846|nr:AMP-binding protein [Sporosarcina sp. Marseille-Q4063]QUW22343.1 AMP-binding protein [Sporosarcina sp. Marseille-Q4063]